MGIYVIVSCIALLASILVFVFQILSDAKNKQVEQDDLKRTLDRGLAESVKALSDEACSNIAKYSIESWTNEQKIACLERQRVFHGLSKNKLRDIAKFGVIKIYESDSIICEQGDEPKHAFFIFDGKVDVIINGSKVSERTATDCVGEIPLLNPAWRRSGMLKVSQRSVIFELPYTKLCHI